MSLAIPFVHRFPDYMLDPPHPPHSLDLRSLTSVFGLCFMSIPLRPRALLLKHPTHRPSALRKPQTSANSANLRPPQTSNLRTLQPSATLSPPTPLFKSSACQHLFNLRPLMFLPSARQVEPFYLGVVVVFPCLLSCPLGPFLCPLIYFCFYLRSLFLVYPLFMFCLPLFRPLPCLPQLTRTPLHRLALCQSS